MIIMANFLKIITINLMNNNLKKITFKNKKTNTVILNI